MTKAEDVFVKQQISFFCGGLKGTLRADVKGQKPHTLKAALSYAKLYESWNNEIKTLVRIQIGTSITYVHGREPTPIPKFYSAKKKPSLQ